MIESIEHEIRILRTTFWSGRDPEGRAFVPLADAYRRAGDFRQAVELLTEGLERHPGFTSAHLVAGQLYAEKGLTAEAELALRRVLDLDPDNVMALELLAETLRDRGETEEADDLRSRYTVLAGVASPSAAEEEATQAPAVESRAEVAAAAAESVVEAEAPASDEGPVSEEPVAAGVDGPVVAIAGLAPEAEPLADSGPVVDIGALAPDQPPVAEGPVVAIADLAPEPAAEPVAEAGPVVDIGALAPDEAPTAQAPIWAVADLAPEPEPVARAEAGPVMDIEALAPDQPPAVDEPVIAVADLAPEPETWADPRPVVDIEALAPDEPEADTDWSADDLDQEPLDEEPLDEEPMVTRTMAELFASQGLTDRALKVFQQLLEASPDDPELRQRVAELLLDKLDKPEEDVAVDADLAAHAELPVAAREEDDLAGHAWDAVAQADHHDVDTPFAWTQQETDELSAEGPPVSAYFSRMLAWRPGAPATSEPGQAEPDRAEDDDSAGWLDQDDL